MIGKFSMRYFKTECSKCHSGVSFHERSYEFGDYCLCKKCAQDVRDVCDNPKLLKKVMFDIKKACSNIDLLGCFSVICKYS